MPPNVEALASEVEALRAQIVELDATPVPEDEAAANEQVARFDAALADFDKKKAALAEAVSRASRVEAVRTTVVAHPEAVERPFQGINVNVKRDPFENLDEVARTSNGDPDLIHRAATAVSEVRYRGLGGNPSDADRESIIDKVERVAGVAPYVLAHSSPAYRSAFGKWMSANGEHSMADYTAEERAAIKTAQLVRTALNITTGSSGQFSLPTIFDPTLIHTGTAAINPLRAISRVETGTQNVWNGVSTGNVTTYWHAEAAALTDGSPTLAHPIVTAGHLTGYVAGSWEFFDDSPMAAQLPGLIGEAMAYAESTSFVTGSGTSQPKGVVTAISATVASTVTATTRGSFTSASSADVFAVVNALPSRYEDTSSWIANKQTYNVIRQMSSAGYGSLFWGNLTNDVTPNPAYPLLGSPTYNSSDMATTTTTGTVLAILGDFRQYLIYDVVGAQVEFLANVVNSSGLPTGQRGLAIRKRVGGNTTDINAFRFLLT